jgi:hypothetical protein
MGLFQWEVHLPCGYGIAFPVSEQEKRERKESHSLMDYHRRWSITHCKLRNTVIILGGQND